MKKKKIILPIAAACVLVAVVLTFRISFSYLMDAEVKDNVITIGNVHVQISEPSYHDSSVVAAGDVVPKNPILTNTGTEDEFVFLKVQVPKKKVTLLYESDYTVTNGNENITYPKGTPTLNNRDNNGKPKASVDEIYRFIAEEPLTSKVDPVHQDPADNNDPKTEPQLDFAYNAGHKSSGESDETHDTTGWVYLSRELNKDVDGSTYDVYYFGYNQRLTYDKDQEKPSATIPLFDKVQLKSFIDEEAGTSSVNNENSIVKTDYTSEIVITGYAIQADSLGITDFEEWKTRDAYLNQKQLNHIFGIVQRKAGG